MGTYLDAAERLTAAVDAVSDWDAASACEGWSAADVIDHVITAQRGLLSRAELDPGERPEGDPKAQWAAHLAVMRPLAQDDAALAREVAGPFGPSTVGALLNGLLGFENLVHAWDLGPANGQPVAFTDAELDVIDALTANLPDASYDRGAFKRLPGAADADRQTALLARIGRAA